jgi:hypothetical protein
MTNTVSDNSLRPCNRLRELNNVNECKPLVSLTKPWKSMNSSEDVCVCVRNVVLMLMCMATVKGCITS